MEGIQLAIVPPETESGLGTEVLKVYKQNTLISSLARVQNTRAQRLREEDWGIVMSFVSLLIRPEGRNIQTRFTLFLVLRLQETSYSETGEAN